MAAAGRGGGGVERRGREADGGGATSFRKDERSES